MTEHELIERLRSFPVDPQSRRRASSRLHAELETSARPDWRRRIVIWLSGLAMLGVFLTTAPGQATVDWVADAIQLDDDGTEVPVGGGELTDGTTYDVYAQVIDDRVCLGMRIDPDAVSEGGLSGNSFCNFERWRKTLVDFPFYGPLESGGTIYTAVASPRVETAEISFTDSSGEVRTEEADVFRLRGDIVVKGGPREPIDPAALIVGLLPEGVGDVAQGSVANLTVGTLAGEELATSTLEWALMYDDVLTGCGSDSEPFQDFCEKTRNGEIKRADKALAKPLPGPLQSALADAGYVYVPATDDDRELAFGHHRAEPHALFEVGGQLSGYDGWAYERLGRISGGEMDSRLVYVFHFFAGSVEYPHGGGGFSHAGSGPEKPPPIFKPEAATFVIDAITGEMLDTLDYGNPPG